MFKHFLTLEWKSFFRSASFATNLVLKIFTILGALYFTVVFILLGFGIYPLLEDSGLEPFSTVNKFLIYYFVLDLTIRFFMQKMPVLNIRTLLPLPIRRNVIVHFSLGKTLFSFFNWIPAFFFIPFSIMLVKNGFSISQIALWHFSIIGLIFTNNFITLLLNNKDAVFYPIVFIVCGCGIAHYFHVFDITVYCFYLFNGFYSNSFLFILPLFTALAGYYFAFQFFKRNLTLDDGLAKKRDVAKTEHFTWLNQFGTLGVFLKNDIRLLKRNKRSRTTVFMSVLFLFYGFLFFNNDHQAAVMGIFAGIFVSGGFLFTFGQFVPSWDSSYYQLMMSQNIQYRDYIRSKWWLVVLATLASTFLASFYLFMGGKVYLLIVTGAIYNIGVNSHLVLLGGAFVKTPIDLSKSKGAFGDKQAFNIKTMLIAVPKLAIPVLLYGLGISLFNETAGMLLVAGVGVLGFAFRNLVFKQIEKIYKSEKYATVAAYKQTSN